MEGIQRPHYEPGTTAHEPLTPQEIKAVLDAAKVHNDPFRALWALMAATGCRPGEALGLARDDIHIENLKKAYVVIRRRLVEVHGRTPHFADHTKGGTGAVLAIDAVTARILAEHLEHQRQERERLGVRYLDYGLCFAHQGGTPLLPRNVDREFKRALKRANVRDTRFYDLRHSAATTILEETDNLKLVQERLRHTSLKVLEKTYLHVRRPQDARVAQTLGTAIYGEGDGQSPAEAADQ
jgi:integrase